MLRPKSHSVCSDGFEWEAILTEVAFSVSEKLLEPLDHVRFATVCKRWSSIAKDYNQTTQRWRRLEAEPRRAGPPEASRRFQGGVEAEPRTRQRGRPEEPGRLEEG
ncbi:hypothetical protein ACLB2K_000464 [Fragaria x ananassa]